MSQVNVPCNTNARSVVVTAQHVDGKSYNFTIESGKCLFDDNGMIRFFVMTWSDGEEIAYILHPSQRHSGKMAWITDFLTGFGLSRARGELIKIPKGTNPAVREAVNVGSYFLFSVAARYVINSFIDSQFPKTQLGYHHYTKDSLVWTSPIFLQT